jgi:type I site-specific restriction-modification system R (restriction) subunit
METKQLEAFNPFREKLDEFKNRYDGIVYNLRDKKQEKQARSDRRSIGSVISKLDQSHAKIKAPLLAHVRLIDGARKEIKDQLLEVQNKIKDQIKAHEERGKELQRRIDSISSLIFFNTDDPNSFEIQQHLDTAQKIKIVDFEDRTLDATETREAVIKSLKQKLAKRIYHERVEEEVELLRKEKEERAREEMEERIRSEAEAAARKALEAEAAARKALEEKIEEANRKAEEERMEEKIEEANRNAEKERMAAQIAKKEAIEVRAKLEIEYARKMAIEQANQEEKKRADADQEEKKRADAERIERERAAFDEEYEEHRNEIHLEIIADFSRLGFDIDDTKAYIKAIAKGSIRHLKIQY